MAPIKTNNPVVSYFDFFSRSGTDAVNPAPVPPPSGLKATGGTINDYESSGTYYRAHIFSALGTLNVTQLSDDPSSYPDTIEYLVVAGGGGGGAVGGGNGGGGGGAGGLRTSLAGHPLAGSVFPVSTTGGNGSGQYTVTVGGGGNGATDGNGTAVSNGVDSYFGPPTAPEGITSAGGGHGGGHHTAPYPASFSQDGGSGGGGGGASTSLGADGNTPPTSPSQGNAGGRGYNGNPYVGGGGGGAGGRGFSRNPDDPNTGRPDGGAGVQVLIAGPPTFGGTGAYNPGPGEYQWFAGGGGGGSYPAPDDSGNGGVGGGGAGSLAPYPGSPATRFTGGGGGGNGSGGTGGTGGTGGSGVVVVRYKISQAQSENATIGATGGKTFNYGTKTIHVFNATATFAVPGSFSKTCDYVIIGGGGGGSNDLGGGGGAGTWMEGTSVVGNSASFTVTVGAGGQAGDGAIPQAATQGVASSSAFPAGTITAPGGGAGGNPSSYPGGEGGSGGGSRGNRTPSVGGNGTGDPFPGTPGVSPSNGWGNDGGDAENPGTGGGGGGAGGIGGNGNNGDGANGGLSVQLPADFRYPSSTYGYPGPGGGVGWFAGGGGSGNYPSPNAGGKGGGAGGPYGGAGDGPGIDNIRARSALDNSGSGGGGGADGSPRAGGAGGSGIVLIAYPT